jgi:hypothetical protein
MAFSLSADGMTMASMNDLKNSFKYTNMAEGGIDGNVDIGHSR